VRRPTSVLAKAFLGTALAATSVSAQQTPPITSASSATDAGAGAAALPLTSPDAPPFNSARGPRPLLRNGWDYINYQEYERALAFFREAQRRQAELNDAERQKLREGIDRAQRGMRDQAMGVKSGAAYARSGATRRPGALALAQPAAAPTPVAPNNTPRFEREPIQLAGGGDVNAAPANVVMLKEPAAAPAELPVQPEPSTASVLPAPPEVVPDPAISGEAPAPIASTPLPNLVPPSPGAAGRVAMPTNLPIDEAPQPAQAEAPVAATGSPKPAPVQTPAPAPTATPAPVPVPGPTDSLELPPPAHEVPLPGTSEPLPVPPPSAPAPPPAEAAPAPAPEPMPAPTAEAAPAPAPLPAPTAEAAPAPAPLPAPTAEAAPAPAPLPAPEPMPAPSPVPTAEPAPAPAAIPAPTATPAAAPEEELVPLPTSLNERTTPAPAPAPVPTPAPETAPAPVAAPTPMPAPVPVPVPVAEPLPTRVAVDTPPAVPSPAAVSVSPADAPPAPAAEEVLPGPVTVTVTEPAPSLPRVSSLTPELQRAVEMTAQRQEDELLRPRQTAPPGNDPMAPPSVPGSTTSRLELQRAPSPTEARPIKGIPVPEEFVPLPKREWDPNRKYWAAAATAHLPLYFQDAVLERYGYSMEQRLGPAGRYLSYPVDDPRQSKQRAQIAQPFMSVGLFLTQIVALPYNLIVDPPWEAEYDLGYYRPGDRVPPDVYYLPWTGVGPPLHGSHYGGPGPGNGNTNIFPAPALSTIPRW
jgi:hypothetical protein